MVSASGPAATPARLRRSSHLSWFAHLGAVYLFHDLYGYIMEMSPDIADLIEAFEGGADTAATIDAFRNRFEGADPAQFVDVLLGHAVLCDPAEPELEGIWAFVPVKGKWNVWHRHDDRVTLWTAWGDRPVTEVMLSEAETKIWDAFDGLKRLVELRHHHDNATMEGLVKRLAHSDVQALKLSLMPMSMYAKRPATTPPYITSTMPYAAWQPGMPVPAAQGDDLSPSDYYKHDVADADAQFDHQETTLSHLLRVPHPALGGKTYGGKLAEVMLARGAIAEGRVRVLEIGAGLGYVAHDVIAALRAAGREVSYTIVELAPALAAAQQKRLGDIATWIMGDVLEAKLADASFDFILSNEMAGDLPAKRLSREDLGMSIDGTGTVDQAKLRALGGGAVVAADLGVNLDDAPEPLYLMTGAFELIARIARWLAPGGSAVVTEFGELAAWPKLSTHLDHPELSTNFGHLHQAARGAKLEAKIEFVIDLLDVDRTLQGLATTRSHFRALRALCADRGIDLAKIGYTPALFDAALGGKLDAAAIGELRWDKIEDRLMGLVPHEFKALIARKPA